MAHLEIETPDGIRHVTLAGEQITIGRLHYNDVMLPYAQISRQHVELRRVTGQWRLVDLHSTNGVQLNGRRVSEHALADGDTVVLAPGILLTYLASDTADTAAETQTRILPSSPPVALQRTPFAPAHVTPPAPTLGPVSPPRVSAPTPPTPPSSRPAPQPTAPPVTASSHASYIPSPPPSTARSVYADDEIPFAPPGTLLPPAAAHRPGASTAPVVPRPPRASSGPVAANPTPAPSHANTEGGYPAPRGPLSTSGPNDSRDPYHRSGSTKERNGTLSGPNSTLLHVCQTCGQLTASDAVYCQSCHSSIAHDCVNCRLSLLPVQERCPRCHTPNGTSVRRAHANH